MFHISNLLNVRNPDSLQNLDTMLYVFIRIKMRNMRYFDNNFINRDELLYVIQLLYCLLYTSDAADE